MPYADIVRGVKDNQSSSRDELIKFESLDQVSEENNGAKEVSRAEIKAEGLQLREKLFDLFLRDAEIWDIVNRIPRHHMQKDDLKELEEAKAELDK